MIYNNIITNTLKRNKRISYGEDGHSQKVRTRTIRRIIIMFLLLYSFF